jgi:hypothetical protein
MAQDAAEIVVGANGSIFVAPTDATLPTDLATPLDAEFADLGFVSEDGATFQVSMTAAEIRVWQSFFPVRRIVTDRGTQLAFVLRQWNADTVVLAFGGGEIDDVTNPGEFIYEPPDPELIDERALVLEWQDGDSSFRLLFPRGNVTENVETQLVRTAAADLPITFGALASGVQKPFRLFTDHPAFAPTS